MRDSDTYQAILEEGMGKALAALHRSLLALGRKRFGEPEAGVSVAVQAIHDPDRLEALIESVVDVGSWDELLDQLPVANR